MQDKQNQDSRQYTYQYTYSAKEQEELKRIRSKYVPKQEDKMETLRRLDAQSTQKATLVSIVIGVVGALIMGLGMSCCMVWMGAWFVPGVVIGIIGIALVALAYPAYSRILKKERARVAPEILRLTDELMK